MDLRSRRCMGVCASFRRGNGDISGVGISAKILFILLLTARPLQSFANLRGRKSNDVRGGGMAATEKLENNATSSRFGQYKTDLQRQTQVIEVRPVYVELTLALHYVDDSAADLLTTGNETAAIVYRFCSAVNQQAGGSQARKSADADSLTLFTRDDYDFPNTGCEILGTNRMYTYGIPPGPNYSSLEILFRQEVFVSPIGNGTLDGGESSIENRVAIHSSTGFSKGSGGRAKFRNLLTDTDPEPVPEFDSVEDFDLTDGLSPPMSRPTAAPSTTLTSASPTRGPTAVLTEGPTTGGPSHDPTARPTTTSQIAMETRTPVPPTTGPTTSPVIPTKPPTIVPPSQYTIVGTSEIPTLAPTTKPSIWESSGARDPDDSDDGTSVGESVQQRSSGDGVGPHAPAAAIAAAAGAGLGILAVGLFSLWRCQTDDDESDQEEKTRSLPAVAASPSSKSRRAASAVGGGGLLGAPPAPPSATSSVARLGARRAPPVPAIVALPVGGDVGSVANSTLGDRTAGRKPPPSVHPPVAIFKTAMRHGVGASSIAASSQISSLESGTIGAGGDRTLGGFSLEAAIKEDRAGDEKAVSPQVLSGKSDPSNAKDSNGPCPVDLSDAAAGDAVLSPAIPSEKEDEERRRATNGGVTPTESLVGTTSLMGASYASTLYSSSKEGEREAREEEKAAVEVAVEIEVVSDGDITPRASGTRITNLNVDLEDGLLFPLHNKDRMEPSSYLPEKLVNDRLTGHSGMHSPPPPSLHSASESSWSDVFAEGTAAILSASFERAASKDAEDGDTGEELVRGVLQRPPSAQTLDLRKEPALPPIIGGRGSGFPAELAGSLTYPLEFPDSGPLADAPSSDNGKDSCVQRTPDDDKENDNEVLSEEQPDMWLEQGQSSGPFEKNNDSRTSDKASVVSSMPPPPPDYPPSPESADGVSHLISTKNSSDLFGTLMEGYSSSSIIEKKSSKHRSFVVLNQHSHGDGTQAADVAAGPSSTAKTAEPHAQTSSTNEHGTPSETGLSYAQSAGQSVVEWAAVAKNTAFGMSSGTVSPKEKHIPCDALNTPTKTGHSSCNEDVKTPPQPHLESSTTECPHSPLTPNTPEGQDDVDAVDDGNSTSSSSSSGNPNPWLLDAVAGALGPRGMSADLESLSERSHRSSRSKKSSKHKSPKSVLSNSGAIDSKDIVVQATSTASVASSRASHRSRRSQNSSASARSITSDLLRLEAQLKIIGSPRDSSVIQISQSFGTDTGSRSNPATPSPPKATKYVGRRTRISVEAPPGRLGVILANRSDGKGTVVSALRTSSPLAGKLSPGDRLEAIDGEDVSNMKVSDVTGIMAGKADQERILTIVTPGKIRLGGASMTSPQPPDIASVAFSSVITVDE